MSYSEYLNCVLGKECQGTELGLVQARFKGLSMPCKMGMNSLRTFNQCVWGSSWGLNRRGT